MFFSLHIKLAIIIYVFLILTIPVGAYLVSENQSRNPKVSARQSPTSTIPVTKPITSTPSATPSLLEAVNNLANPTETLKPKTANQDNSPTIADSFGPTLSLTLSLEGRPSDKQTSKVFVGIKDKNTSSYILSFTIDLPASGIYNGLSLAGLTAGNQYTAVIKATAQIAKIATFNMGSGTTKLNNNQTIVLTTGDLNEDNVINSADYSISKALLGTTSASNNWNELADFNSDGVINIIDLSFITKNFGKIGDSGVWVSTEQQEASSSTAEATASGKPAGHPSGDSGYWLWVPR